MINQKNLEQFNRIYDETYNNTLKFIVCKCSNMEDVNDILQETYLEIYNSIKKARLINDYNKYLEASKRLNKLITNIQNNFQEFFDSLVS